MAYHIRRETLRVNEGTVLIRYAADMASHVPTRGCLACSLPCPPLFQGVQNHRQDAEEHDE